MKKKQIHDEYNIEIPEEIKQIGFDFPRDIKKIWELQIEPIEMSIDQLTWHLELPFFWQIDKPFSLKPGDVIKNPEKYEYRYNRIMNVDESFAIDVMMWKGRLVILDGLHRLCKQVIQGKKIVKVRIVPNEWKDKIMPDLV